MSPELKTALDAARTAARISRHYYDGTFDVRIKDDRTPVTQADVECEQAIRDAILGAFPGDGFYGEETGASQLHSQRLWLVDPIDGTQSFIRHYPFFSTQIALRRAGRIDLGVSCGTMFDELAWAERGHGAWLNDGQLRVSEVDAVEDATISTGNLKSLAQCAGWARLADWVAKAGRFRGYGDFYHYHLLAAGKIDAVIESDVNILDIAALSVLVEEAGGVFTDFNGRPPGLETRSVLAGNPAMHAQLLGNFEGLVP